jgi:hypothetical protein
MFLGYAPGLYGNRLQGILQTFAFSRTGEHRYDGIGQRFSRRHGPWVFSVWSVIVVKVRVDPLVSFDLSVLFFFLPIRIGMDYQAMGTNRNAPCQTDDAWGCSDE